MNPSDQALVQIGHHLKARAYRFTTPTPLTHARVNARMKKHAAMSLEDVFGWNRPFDRAILPPDLYVLLKDTDVLEQDGLVFRSKVRFSTLGNLLLMHSQFPTTAPDSVFFGPDTYRFTHAIQVLLQQDPSWQPTRIIDIGCGTGAGAYYARTLLPATASTQLILGDVNEAALRFAAVNAAINALPNTKFVQSDVLAAIAQPADLIVSNPPYLVDPAGRVYRNGGGTFGCDLSCRIVEESIAKLTPRGKLLLYTGAPIVGGHDKFYEAVLPILKDARCVYSYEEIDPDVFGEELEEPSYQTADRIAVVALIVDKGKSHAS